MNTDEQKVSYIIGRQIGSDFKKQNIKISFDDFFQGVRSSFLSEANELDDNEVNRVMTAFQEKMKLAHEELTKEALKVNLASGQAFLAENKKDKDVTVTDSGLQYRIIKSGNGATPSLSSTVETHYEGTLIDGTVFDSSYQRGAPISFPVNGVIKGWTEALQLMKEGDVWELAIPPELAYGERGAGADIAPNSTLKFKIELISVK